MFGLERLLRVGRSLYRTELRIKRNVDVNRLQEDRCRTNRLEPSMSRRDNCWDNAVAESFFSSLKKERIKKRIYKNRDLANADTSDYIESFYDRSRRHKHLGGVSPEAFEVAAKER